MAGRERREEGERGERREEGGRWHLGAGVKAAGVEAVVGVRGGRRSPCSVARELEIGEKGRSAGLAHM